MKDRIDAILQREQAEYLDSLLPERDELLTQMELYAEEHGHPIADPEVAQFLRILVRAARPKNLLEVGTAIGYSVVVMGRECDPSAKIDTIEIDPANVATARGWIEQAALPCEVVFHTGAALDVLSSLAGPFDFVFIDCVKTEYGLYLDALESRMPPGAILVCDNLLWKGQVASGPYSPDQIASTAALGMFNNRIATHPRLITSILPLGDGLGVSIVR